MAQRTGVFKVMMDDGKSYAIYYQCGNGYFVFYRIWNEDRGIFFDNPTRRITASSYVSAKAIAQIQADC